ncbi:MAG: LacI family DNA-binding transcriptional regulator [Spirochaetota bacterium]
MSIPRREQQSHPGATTARRRQLTLHDIAREAGTSVSTVSRVLNGRAGAGEQTRARVLEIVERMNYTVNYAASNLKKRTATFLAIFREHDEIGSRYAAHVEEGYTACRRELSTFKAHFETRYAPVDEAAVFGLLNEIYEDESQQIDGLLLTPFRSQRIIELLHRFVEAGVPVVFADKDLPSVGRITCVKPNNAIAGQLAAELMYRFLRSDGTVLITDADVRTVYPIGEADRIGTGSFIETIQSYTTGVRVEPIREPYVDERLYDEVRTRLETDPDIVGIFSASARHTAAAGPALRDSGRQDEVQMIGSEVFAESFALLREGVIDALIYKNPFRVGYKALDSLFGYVVRGVRPPSEILVMPRVVLSSGFTNEDEGYSSLLET